MYKILHHLTQTKIYENLYNKNVIFGLYIKNAIIIYIYHVTTHITYRDTAINVKYF